MKEIRLVWNLTNKCPFRCSFCAASANSKEEMVEKRKILDSILSASSQNIFIDFSGGDPLFCEDLLELIKLAVSIIGKEKISISSTCLSLEKLTDNELINLCNNYELTYDFPIKYGHLDKRDIRYNKLNYKQAQRIKRLSLNLNIFVTLQAFDDEIIEELAFDLWKLSPDSISIIRLMPLGYLNIKQKGNYDEIGIYNKLKNRLREKGYKNSIKPTCAFRALLKEEHACNMISEKYGIDHLGNFFTCIWASDLSLPDNPFYLGNLIDSNLRDLIKTNYKVKNAKKCSVCEYLKNNIK